MVFGNRASRSPALAGLTLLFTLLVMALVACERQTADPDAATSHTPAVPAAEQTTPEPEPTGEAGGQISEAEYQKDIKKEEKEQPTAEPNYVELGDLGALRKRGIIRIVSMTGDNQNILPRAAIVNQTHTQLAEQLAARLKLEPRWFIADSPVQALRMVAEGEADLVADNITDNKERREIVEFTIPVTQTRDVLVTGTNGPDISDVENLRGTEFVVLADTTYAQLAHAIVASHPEANLSVREVQLIDERDTMFDIVTQVGNAVTILHKNLAEETLKYRKDLRIGAAVGELENIGWALRKNSPRLENRINNFLTRTLVTEVPKRTSHWYAIKDSKVLRFATYNGPTSYYLWKGVLRGFDYSMAKAFADRHKLQLKVIVVPDDEDLSDWVVEGRADVAGASTTITDERRARGVDFSTPYLETPQRIVSNRDKPRIETLDDLQGRTLTLRAFSSFIEVARTLQKSGIDFQIEIAPEEMSFAQILNKVADGEFDATIEDTSIADMQAALRPSLVLGLQISDPLPQGWMVKRGNKDLLKQVDRFMQKFRDSDEYQKIFNAYFKPDKHLVQQVSARVIPGKDLSPFDKLVKTNSLNHDLDWRLITAQMWQESNFNPKATSPVGAQGLLQVMPRTAQDMGFPPPLYEPDRNLQAGTKYLNWIRNRFKDPVPFSEKLWFMLASYNAGLGHVYDAQRLAKQLGLDPEKWFDNVEVAMLKLAEPRYFEKARYGYCRGSEPVAYVRKISNLYKAYTTVASGEIAGRNCAPCLKGSGQSCQYACSTPLAGAPLPHPPAQKSLLFADEFCPLQSAARPSLPAHWLCPPSPPLPAASGWNQ